MIVLVPSEHDDPSFLTKAQRILNGADAALQAREVYLVQIDNWFDHKWLGWSSRWKHKQVVDLRIPMFNPNRVRSDEHLVWDAEKYLWKACDLAKPLHVRQAGRPLLARRLDTFPAFAAFFWYSGNTWTNKAGSMMYYLSGADSYAWYASFKKAGHWTVADEFRITRRELESFEERGLQMELAQPIGLPE